MDSTNRQIPTLVQLCQRVASTHVDYIFSLGDDLRYSLVKPILERCSPEQLLRLEQASPHIQKDTPQIWKDLCFQKYPLPMERHSRGGELDEPESWKDQFFFLREEEAKRLEEAGARLRNQRLEAEEKKRGREVKLTDRLPPPKRQRTGGWATNPQPKTLFEKTKTKASQLQKTMYHARIIPPMPNNGRAFHILSKQPGEIKPLLPPSSDTSRVTVNTVVHRRLSTATAPLSSLASSSAARPVSGSSPPQSRPSVPSTPTLPSSSSNLSAWHSTGSSSSRQPPMGSTTPSAPSDSRPLKPLTPGKRDPMASLFMPKRQAYSQRPV